MEEAFKDCNSNHVFKKCCDNVTGHDCILMLEKPQIGFICNESRKSVINKDMAKFRCNGLNVVVIFDLELQEIVNSIIHNTNSWSIPKTLTWYQVGSFVKPDDFNTDLNIICSNGIHYFLTLQAALSYDIGKGRCCIDDNEFDAQGEIAW
jgi:hypothetical protein